MQDLLMSRGNVEKILYDIIRSSQLVGNIDRLTGKKSQLVMRDLVFINWRTGEPTKNSSYDIYLYKLCDETNIKRFSMHVLRHTYATRAIESEMQPKILQKCPGMQA